MKQLLEFGPFLHPSVVFAFKWLNVFVVPRLILSSWQREY